MLQTTAHGLRDEAPLEPAAAASDAGLAANFAQVEKTNTYPVTQP